MTKRAALKMLGAFCACIAGKRAEAQTQQSDLKFELLSQPSYRMTLNLSTKEGDGGVSFIEVHYGTRHVKITAAELMDALESKEPGPQ